MRAWVDSMAVVGKCRFEIIYQAILRFNVMLANEDTSISISW